MNSPHGSDQALPSRTTVLVVEDSPTQRAMLRFLLEDAGHIVLTASDGREGVAAAAAIPVDLVISDIVMPEMNGYELCKALREAPALRHLPVILLTSLADPRDVIKGLEAGANNFICKPYEDAELLARVHNVLANQALRKTSTSEMGISIYFAGQRFFITADRLQILDLLLSTYENAVTRNTELTHARNELRALNEHLEQRVAERTLELGERVKELRCLYAISTLVAEPRATIAASLEAAVDLIPSGWMWPEITAAKITFEGRTFTTAKFVDSPWRQSVDIVIAGETLGSVEVSYLEERPARDDGPFLREERELITDIARQLGVMIQRERVAQGLRESQEQLRRHLRELNTRHRIAEIFLTVPDDEMFTTVLDVVLDVMESQFGVFGYLDEDGALVVPTMTREIWSNCQVAARTHNFPRTTWGQSTWATTLREQRTICSNEPSPHTPSGHLKITRHISLPLVHQGQLIGLVMVANKETDYSAEDLALLARIGEMLAPVLDARLGRERAAAAMLREKTFADKLLGAQRDTVFLFDPANGQPLRWNRQFEVVSGYSAEEIARLVAPAAYYDEEDLARASEGIARILAEGEGLVELSLVTKAGARIPFEYSVTVVEAQDGRPLLLSIGRDATERKRAEADLAQRLEELERWHDVMLGREDRVLELKGEVNVLCSRVGETARYASMDERRDDEGETP